MRTQFLSRLIFLGVSAWNASHGSADSVKIHLESTVEFASVEEARDLLSKRDPFVTQMSDIDRQLRLGSIDPVGEAAYLRFVRQQVVSWDPAEINRLTEVLRQIRPLLEPFKALWPARITLVKTTGLEEAGAAHCRGTAIVLPRAESGRTTEAMRRLLLHELFHLLSSHSPDVRADLYQVVGFAECPNIPLPPELQSRKLTNPDAPALNCVMTLDNNESTCSVTPILLSRKSSYESMSNRTLFSELQFRLLVVVRHDKGWRAKLIDGKPELLIAQDQRSFQAQIGRNTRYVIHPEEILADNFVELVLKTEDLPDTWIVRRMSSILAK